MDNPLEVQEPQNPSDGDQLPQTPEVVTLTKEEYDALQFKASQSSQNYERAKKAEQRNKELEEDNLSVETVPSMFDDDETVGLLKTQLSETKETLSEIQKELYKSKVIEKYPLIKEAWDDFESFRELPENKGMNMMTAAKAFMIEKDLLETERKGLEGPTGGDRTPIPSGMSADEVKRLRENDPRKYREMIKKGQLKIA